MDEKSDSKVGYYIIFGVLALIVVLCHDGPDAERSHEPDFARQAYKMAQEYVKASLKAPATAVFPEYGSSAIIISPGSGTGFKSFKVASYVDSQNSFGALLRTHYIADLDYNNGEWKLLSLYFP
ncbi:MAG: hypothetical protein U0V64_15550 [Cyclobacteriaceae bacterium]